MTGRRTREIVAEGLIRTEHVLMRSFCFHSVILKGETGNTIDYENFSERREIDNE